MLLLKLSWRNIWRNKKRSIITVAMIFMAVILSVAMQSIQQGVYKRMIDNVVTYHTGYVQVADSFHWQEMTLESAFVPAELDKIGRNAGVDDWVHRIENGALISMDSTSQVAIVIGSDPNQENELTGLASRVVEGKYFQANSKGLLVAQGLAQKLKLEVGDSLILISQGYHASSASGLYHIECIATFGSPELNEKMIYMPLKLAQDFFSMPGLVTKSAAIINNEDYHVITKALNKEFSQSSLKAKHWEEVIPELKSALELDATGGIFMLGILYFIIAFGIFGTILMMMQERKREFGILTAIGMKKSKLSLTLIIELIIMSVIGSVLGMVLAVPVILLLYHFPIHLTGSLKEAYMNYGFEPILQAGIFPEVFVNNALVVLFISSILSLYPLYVISKMKTIQNLKS